MQANRISAFYTACMTIVVLAIGLFLLVHFEPRFASHQNLINILLQAAPLVLVSLAQGVIVISGGIDLAQGAVVALAGILGMLVALDTGVAWLGWIVVILLSAALGAINGALVGWLRVPAFVATAGMLTYADGISYLVTGGLPIEFPPDGYSVFGRGFLGTIPVSIPVVALITLAVCYLMHRTRVGRGIYLVGDNDAAARIVGINPERYRFYAFTIAGVLTGCASIILTGRIDSAPPSLAPNLQFEAIASVAIGGIAMTGGRGAIWQAVLGVVPVAVTENALNLFGVGTGYQLVAIGAVTIIVVAIQLAPSFKFKRAAS